MAAFLPTPAPVLPTNLPGPRSTSLARPSCRPRPWRPHAARIHVSATTEEVRAPDNLRLGADQNGIPTGDASSLTPPSPPSEAPEALSSPTPPEAPQAKLKPPPSLAGPPTRRTAADKTASPPTSAAPPKDSDVAGGEDETKVTVTYYTRCGNCTAVFEINPTDLGRGSKVRCSVCENTWFQRADRLLTLEKEEAFIDYPLDKKSELIEKAAETRRSRPARPPRDGGGGGGGPGGERRPYNREGRGSREGRGDRERSYGGGERRGRGGGARSNFSVFIGNLPYTVTEEELREVVRTVLPDGRVSLVKDHETGRPKGFAFCDCKSEEEVEMAVEMLNGKDVNGRAMLVRPGRKNSR